jgi:hypothetical protein
MSKKIELLQKFSKKFKKNAYYSTGIVKMCSITKWCGVDKNKKRIRD